MFIDPIIDSTPGATVMADIVNSAHRRIIGENDEPVTISGEQLIQIVRDERAVDVPGLPIVLPVPKIGTLDLLDTMMRWFVPVMAALGALILLLAHRDPSGSQRVACARSASSASRSPPA